jgi:hypothetical protein
MRTELDIVSSPYKKYSMFLETRRDLSIKSPTDFTEWGPTENIIIQNIKRRDGLTMSYFDNFDNSPLNKYKKNKK